MVRHQLLHTPKATPLRGIHRIRVLCCREKRIIDLNTSCRALQCQHRYQTLPPQISALLEMLEIENCAIKYNNSKKLSEVGS